MKTCSYCGKEYPDDMLICKIDQNPLTNSKPKPHANSPPTHPKQEQPFTGWRFLSAGGFIVLSGLFGLGLTWLVVGITTAFGFKTEDAKMAFVTKSMPILLAGGIIGLAIGVVVALKVLKADPETEIEIERKYVGTRGRIRIYLGAPIFVVGLFSFYFEKLLKKLGTEPGVYVALGIALAIIALSLVAYDRIPAKYIVPIGIIGWLLTISMIVCFLR